VGHVKTNVAIPFSRERGPSVWMNFRLVSAQTGEILYAETVQYGDQQNPMIDGATLPAPTDHKFESVDEVKANISKLFDYIKSGIDSIASAVADRLAR